VIDKCAAVIFFANVNTNKTNSSQQVDYKVWSHDLGNPPHSYYYVKKVLQVVRLVINIRVKKGYIQSLKTRCTSYSCNKMHGIKHGICVVFQTPSWRCKTAVGCLLPTLETFHSTTTEKSIRLFTDVTIHEVVWYVIKQWRWCNKTAVLSDLNKFSRCY
jgi:hypothetical protein